MAREKASPKSKDYDVRAAVVSALLAGGIPRSDIRHELTLDTYSSGGRADMVVLRDTRIIGIEMKSGSDVLDRCEAQCRGMDLAFDAHMVVADVSLIKPGARSSNGHWVYFSSTNGLFSQYPEQLGSCGGNWRPFDMMWLGAWIGSFTSRGTSPMWMASTLWANEVCALTGSRTRYKALEAIREGFTLKEVRRHTIAQLRGRCMGKWDLAFWQRYDAVSAADSLAT